MNLKVLHEKNKQTTAGSAFNFLYIIIALILGIAVVTAILDWFFGIKMDQSNNPFFSVLWILYEPTLLLSFPFWIASGWFPQSRDLFNNLGLLDCGHGFITICFPGHIAIILSVLVFGLLVFSFNKVYANHLSREHANLEK
jgi:hypothetical protein